MEDAIPGAAARPAAVSAVPRAGRVGFGERPYALLIFTTGFWGLNAVAGRLAVGEVSPGVLTSLRWLVVVAVLAVAARRTILAERSRILTSWRPIALMGAFGFTLFNSIMYEAAHYTSAVNIGIVQGSMPVIVLAGSYLAYRTPVRALQLVGLAITLVGVAVVASRGDLDVLRRLDFNVGDLAMLFASLLYGGYTVALKRRPPMAPLAFFAGVAVAAFLSSLPLLGLEVALGRALWPTPKGWFLVAFVGIFASLISQVTYLRAVEMIGPGRAGLFVNLVPVFAAIGGVVLLGEHFVWYHALALALVLGGIAVAETGRRER